MVGPAPGPGEPPTLGRALALLGVSLVLTLLLLLAFGYFPVSGTRASGYAAMFWFSAALPLGAVLLPTIVACYWPPADAPGRLPSYARPPREVVLGTLFVSLPLYAASAALLFAIGAWDSGAVTPATPGGTPHAAPTFGALVALWVVWAVLPAIAEELMYRGVIQPAIAHRWGAAWGIAVTAALFAFSHGDRSGLVPRLIMGAWFGFLALRTRSLWSSTWAHMLNNTWGVILLGGGGLIAGRPGWVATASLASLAAGVGFFWRAGWFAPREEEPSAATAVLRLKGDEGTDGVPRVPSPDAEASTSPPRREGN